MGKLNSAELFIKDVNGLASHLIVDDNTWRLFGYKKRPKRGAYFNFLVNKEKLKIEKFILRELYIICISNAVSIIENDIKTIYLIVNGIIDHYLERYSMASAFSFPSNLDAYNYFYQGVYDYFNAENKVCLEVFMDRTNNILGSFNASWIVSFIQLCSVSMNPLSNINKHLKEKYKPVLNNDIVFKVFEFL